MGAIFRTMMPTGLAVADFQAARGRILPTVSVILSRQSLPTDPAGTATVTFSGVQAGSEIRVYLPDSTEIAGIESCAADQTLAWPAYVAGSPNNTVRIVILSNTYRLKEFTYTSSVGAQNLPIQQERDQWYSNPA